MPAATLLDQPVETTNPFDSAASLMGQAGANYAALGAPGTVRQSMNKYLNPYYKQVIADTTSNMQRDMNRSLVNVGDSAAAAGAFGGGRHGLVESQVMAEGNRNIGQMTNQMLAERFNTAAGLGQQDIANRMTGLGAAAAGQQSLAGQYYGIGQNITQQQMGAGQQQQDLLQQILSGAGQQFNNQLNSPMAALQIIQAALAADPRQGNMQGFGNGTQEGQYKPGGMDFLGMGLQGLGTLLGGGGLVGAGGLKGLFGSLLGGK